MVCFLCGKNFNTSRDLEYFKIRSSVWTFCTIYMHRDCFEKAHIYKYESPNTVRDCNICRKNINEDYIYLSNRGIYIHIKCFEKLITNDKLKNLIKILNYNVMVR